MRPTLFGGPLDGEVLLDRPPGAVLFVLAHPEGYVASVSVEQGGEFDLYVRPFGDDFQWVGRYAFAARPPDAVIEHLWAAVIRRAALPEGLD